MVGNRIGKAKTKESRNSNYLEWIKCEEHTHEEKSQLFLFRRVSFSILPLLLLFLVVWQCLYLFIIYFWLHWVFLAACGFL